MSKDIYFVAKDQFGFDTQLKPYPASANVPQWFKDEPPYEVNPENKKGKTLIVEDGSSNASFKKCTPMLDGITSGYIIPLWTDVQIRIAPEGYQKITWRTQQSPFDKHGDVFQKHGDSAARVKPPVGYDKVFKYVNTWIPKTPPGYSVMVSHPAGYEDVPFRAIPAIIDSDKSELELVFPMWLQKGFEGIVEKGTPMIQITPFKRDSWTSHCISYEGNEYQKIQERNFNSTIFNNYIKNHWTRKVYR